MEIGLPSKIHIYPNLKSDAISKNVAVNVNDHAFNLKKKSIPQFTLTSHSLFHKEVIIKISHYIAI